VRYRLVLIGEGQGGGDDGHDSTGRLARRRARPRSGSRSRLESRLPPSIRPPRLVLVPAKRASASSVPNPGCAAGTHLKRLERRRDRREGVGLVHHLGQHQARRRVLRFARAMSPWEHRGCGHGNRCAPVPRRERWLARSCRAWPGNPRSRRRLASCIRLQSA
jgi:hypothetical protein